MTKTLANCDGFITENFWIKSLHWSVFWRSLTVVEVVQTPAGDLSDESLIRDVSDRPILRAAVKAQADILITGDKDFLESGIKKPKIMTASAFVNRE